MVEVSAELLAAVIRQHASVITTTPGPFLVATNNILPFMFNKVARMVV